MRHLPQTPIRFDPTERPQLIVVIDTEEEFDWNKPVSRESDTVESMQFIHRVQDIFDEYGITPCYVIDYPIASKPLSQSVLKPILDDGRCEIGAHLHPWVNPPLTETLQPSNTYPGNLERDLEFEKLKTLTQTIQQNFDHQPTAYKAGRYGFGPNTRAILEQLGYEIDLSFCPAFDHGADGGPDFSRITAQPIWFQGKHRLLEIPITSAYIGLAGGLSRPVFNLGQSLKSFKLPGILSRLGIVDRLVLSPEGYTAKEHIKVTQELYRQGIRTFTWSFHSPTVMPGTTDYVKNEKDLQVFLDSFRQYFDFFFQELSGIPSSPNQLKSQLES